MLSVTRAFCCSVSFLALSARACELLDGGASIPNFTERDYQVVAALRSDEAMEAFVKQVLAKLGRKVVDESKFHGFVPHYSGSRAVQNFAKMQSELREADWTGCLKSKSKKFTSSKGSKRGHQKAHGSTEDRQEDGTDSSLIRESPALQNLGAPLPSIAKSRNQSSAHSTQQRLRGSSKGNNSSNQSAPFSKDALSKLPAPFVLPANSSASNGIIRGTTSTPQVLTAQSLGAGSHGMTTNSTQEANASSASKSVQFAHSLENTAILRMERAATALQKAKEARKTRAVTLQAADEKQMSLADERANASLELANARNARAASTGSQSSDAAEAVRLASQHFQAVTQQLSRAKVSKKKLAARLKAAEQAEQHQKAARVAAVTALEHVRKEKARVQREATARNNRLERLISDEARLRELMDQSKDQYLATKQELADLVDAYCGAGRAHNATKSHAAGKAAAKGAPSKAKVKASSRASEPEILPKAAAARAPAKVQAKGSNMTRPGRSGAMSGAGKTQQGASGSGSSSSSSSGSLNSTSSSSSPKHHGKKSGAAASHSQHKKAPAAKEAKGKAGHHAKSSK